MLVYQHADKVHKVGVKTTKPVKKTPGNEALSKLLHLYLGEFIILHPVLPFNQSLKLFWLPGLCKVWQKVNSFRIITLQLSLGGSHGTDAILIRWSQ